VALVRERIALPDGLTFEAVTEDIARADAPAERIAATGFETSGQPPFAFEITYDPETLQPQGQYALRATLHRDGQLFATTDRIVRVLQEDTPETVEVTLRLVPRPVNAPEPPLPAHGLRLPASFRGTLPCADCDGIRHHLDLWPDQVYQLSREWLGRAEGPSRRDELGRWYADPAREAIVLFGASEMPLFWQVMAPDRLRQMDMQGNPIESDLDYELTSAGRLEPTDLEGMFLLGMMTYQADAAIFEECLSGFRYPIAQEADYLALERAYLEARAAPGAPLLVHVEGGLAPRPAMEGPDRTSLIVDRFIKTIPGETCSRHQSTASLMDTYWRIAELQGTPVPSVPAVREAHLILRDFEGSGYIATVGCNRLIGGFQVEGDALTFTLGATTRMACPPPLDDAERDLRAVLEATRGYRLVGQSLQLIDAEGTDIAVLGAVYLR
jgi:uncharacterized lipoprotein YbaY/heat shock protein HslJ